MSTLEEIVASVRLPDESVRNTVLRRLDAKTKPRGSLGRLEELAATIAAIRHESHPAELRAAIVLAAGDHGVAAEGVSAYPAEVTGQMVANFVAGGAAVNVLARQAGARLVLVDAGMLLPSNAESVRSVRLGSGTANFTREPAMSRETALRGLLAGAELATELADEGITVVALGEMGIANTTAAAALLAVLVPADAAAVCGHGTGVDDKGVDHKVAIVRQALELHSPDPDDHLGVLATLGGFEIAVLAGAILGAAGHGMPVVLDGVIVAAAALVAARLAPAVTGSCIAAHRSPEPGHTVALDALGLTPLLDLGLRLGEGSGAALALPLCHAAVAILGEMATFEQAAVTDAGA